MTFNIIKIYNNIKNITPIIASFIMGISFWFYAKTDTTITSLIKYPVKVNPPHHLIMTNAFPDSITLKVTGKIRLQWILRSISTIIKIPSKHTGLQTIQLKKQNLRFPAYLRLKNYEIVDPDSIKIRLDSLIQKEVKIILSRGLRSDPEKVIIKGPKGIIKDINYLSPDSIPTGNLTTITLENRLINVFPNKVRIIR